MTIMPSRILFFSLADFRSRIHMHPRLPPHHPVRPHVFLLLGYEIMVDRAVRSPAELRAADQSLRH